MVDHRYSVPGEAHKLFLTGNQNFSENCIFVRGSRTTVNLYRYYFFLRTVSFYKLSYTMHRCGHEIEDEYAKDIYTKVERKRLEMKEAMNIETV